MIWVSIVAALIAVGIFFVWYGALYAYTGLHEYIVEQLYVRSLRSVEIEDAYCLVVAYGRRNEVDGLMNILSHMEWNHMTKEERIAYTIIRKDLLATTGTGI